MSQFEICGSDDTVGETARSALMPRKRLSLLPFDAHISDNMLRLKTDIELDRCLNSTFNILEKYENAAKKSRQSGVRFGCEMGIDTAKAIVKQIQGIMDNIGRSSDHSIKWLMSLRASAARFFSLLEHGSNRKASPTDLSSILVYNYEDCA
jgi:hypothetical protein